MSAAFAYPPPPLSPLALARTLFERLPARDRAGLRWSVPEIERLYARLFEEPLDDVLVGDVVREVMRIAFKMLSLIQPLVPLVPPEVPEMLLTTHDEMRRADVLQTADFLADQEASRHLVFATECILLARGLLTRQVLLAGIATVTREPPPDMMDFFAIEDAGGISRAQILIEALVEGMRRRDEGRCARAIELAHRACQEAERGATAFLGVILEPLVQDLGRRRGGPAEIQARKERRRQWPGTGFWGAWWLARRLRSERDVEVLADAASVLADMGRDALAPILMELDRGWPDGPPEQIEALLSALRWLRADTASLEAATNGLAPWLACADADLRERAISATQALPAPEAQRLLRAAAEHEADATLKELINQELHERAAADDAA